ncbi:hypothetical protein [Sandarakinorhabdus sp.]|uniref:hypothetical protein n=1 Tax=Sandarakinorhabdus sp. TaxID=1916663 RepID=UPI00356AA38A
MTKLTAAERVIVTDATSKMMHTLREICRHTPSDLHPSITLSVAKSAVATMIGNGLDPSMILRQIEQTAAEASRGELTPLPSQH